jgi:hypothetical protein
MTEDAPREPVGRDAAIKRAYAEVFAICNGKRWIMHVPVEETDSDMVITAALQRADALVAEMRALREAAIAVTEIAPLLSDEFCSRCPYCNGGEPEEYYHDEDFPHSEDCPWKRLEALVGDHS